MKGGFNNPPNAWSARAAPEAAPASMKGGFNNPPNLRFRHGLGLIPAASMKGGFNNPPNQHLTKVHAVWHQLQ